MGIPALSGPEVARKPCPVPIRGENRMKYTLVALAVLDEEVDKVLADLIAC